MLRAQQVKVQAFLLSEDLRPRLPLCFLKKGTVNCIPGIKVAVTSRLRLKPETKSLVPLFGEIDALLEEGM